MTLISNALKVLKNANYDSENLNVELNRTQRKKRDLM